MSTYCEFSLVVEDLHAPADGLYLVDDSLAAASLNDIDQ